MTGLSYLVVGLLFEQDVIQNNFIINSATFNCYLNAINQNYITKNILINYDIIIILKSMLLKKQLKYSKGN